MSTKEVSGPLQKLESGGTATKGSIVFLKVDPDTKFGALQPILAKLRQDGAAAIILSETKEARGNWSDLAGQRVRPGDLVLVKGSRGIRTDAVVDRLKVEYA
jgi:UDP-N-acetylmuramyl pentapeptide synthase